MEVYSNAIKAASNPCESFSQGAEHDDSHLAQAGERLRETWCSEAMAHPRLAPLASFAKRCQRMHWPNGETAGTLLYDVAKLTSYITKLEQRLAASEGDILRSEGGDE